MKKIRAVLFDMDGLLIDTERQSMRAACALGEEMGFKLEIPVLARAVMGVRREHVVQSYGSVLPDWVDPEAFYAKKNERMREISLTEGVPPMKGAAELLRWLHDHGIACVLATATQEPTAVSRLQSAGLLEYLSLRVTGNMVQNSKPHPETYLKAAEVAGVPIEECLVLEDSFNGIRAGRASGAVVGMVPDCLPYDESCAPYCDQVFGSLLDVIEWLEA